MDYAAYQTLNSDFNAMKESVEAVETTKDENVSAFSQQLEAEVEVINREAKAIRNAAQVRSPPRKRPCLSTQPT
jgi:hypothetical protein